MLAILSITFPLYAAIALGYVMVRWGPFQPQNMPVFGGYVLNVALPALLFNAVATRDVSDLFNLTYMAVFLAGSLATIAVERLFDGITMLGFILGAATVVSLTSDLRHVAIVAFIVFAVGILLLVLLTVGGDFRDRLIQLVLGPLPTSIADRIERMAESFLAGLGVLRRRRDLAMVALSSVLAWTFEASMYWVIARGFPDPLPEKMTFSATMLTTGVANLATLIPSSPGYVGPFETGVTLVVEVALGVSGALALSYAFLVHAALFFPVTIVGLIVLWRERISLRAIRDVEDRFETAETAA